MKANDLIVRLKEIVEIHGDLEVSVMQEHNAKKDGIHQIESEVTDVACSPKDRVVIIGKELI